MMKRLPLIVFIFSINVCYPQVGGRIHFLGQTLAVSPEVRTDRSAVFRLIAPQAKMVSVKISGMQPIQMQKGEDGIWSIATDIFEPDIYPYQFIVDGLIIADPANPLTAAGYGVKAGQSLVEVPGTLPVLWEYSQVPQGTITEHFYHSGVIGDQRNFFVYVPPGYDPHRKEKYPVLYLLHGLTGDATAWFVTGRANVMVDNLLAAGTIQPMIIVCPLGYGDPSNITKGIADHLKSLHGLFLKK